MLPCGATKDFFFVRIRRGCFGSFTLVDKERPMVSDTQSQSSPRRPIPIAKTITFLAKELVDLIGFPALVFLAVGIGWLAGHASGWLGVVLQEGPKGFFCSG